MEEHAVSHFGGRLGHQLADGREVHRWRAPLVRLGREERRHEGVGVELALERQRCPVLPGVPDGAHGEHELTHPGSRPRPRHGEASLDMRLDLGAQPEDESPPGVAGKIKTYIRQRHRRPGEGDRDGGPDCQIRGGVTRPQRQQKRIVPRLAHPQAVVPRGLGFSRVAVDIVDILRKGRIDLHRASPAGRQAARRRRTPPRT